MKNLNLPKESQEALLNGASMFIESYKFKTIRNWNGTENKNPKVLYDNNNMPYGCELVDIYTDETSECTDYTFIETPSYQIGEEVYLQEEFINQMGRIVYSDTREFSCSGVELIETASEMEEYQSRWKGVIKNVNVVKIEEITAVQIDKILNLKSINKTGGITIENYAELIDIFKDWYNKQYGNYDKNPYMFLYEIERN
jgi:hypothetical protein